jgi:two-component system, LuxR family, sensor kinase FixL
MLTFGALSRRLATGLGAITFKPTPGGPSALAAGALLIAYVALEWASFIHEYGGLPVTPWNPGLGVAFGMIVLKGAAYGLVLFAGVVIAEILVLRTGLDWPVILAIAAVVAAGYGAAGRLVRTYLRLDIRLNHVRDVLVLLGAGVAGAAVVAVLLGVLLLTDRDLGADNVARSVIPLFVGDVIGIAVVTPLLLRFMRWKWPSRDAVPALVAEVLIFALATGLALWVIVGSARPNDYKYFSLLFLPVVGIGVRHGIDGACLALAATQLGLIAMLNVYGYDAATFTEFQVVMFVLTATGLLVGAVVSERQHADMAAREAEERLKESQSQASRAARMTLVGGMASALAHEINQPMTAARALARSVQHILGSPNADLARAETNLEAVVAQIDHAGGVVRRMREFLRRGQPRFSTLDVAVMLNGALALARPEAAAHRTRIDLALAEPLPPIFGDSVQLQQVVLNLLRNAMDAIAETKSVEGRVQVRANLGDDGSALEIAVVDNGIGVSTAGTLFEPLSSSKSEGLGLGLSICANIIAAHGGRIWLAASRPGHTEFRLSLPVQAQQEPRA